MTLDQHRTPVLQRTIDLRGSGPCRTRRGRTAALLAAVALVAGGAGGVVGASVSEEPAVPLDRSQSIVVPTALEGGVAEVAAQVLPSVVSITVAGRTGSGSGSGVVLDEQGHVLTNDHVVALGEGGRIEVTFHDGQRVPARIVGRAPDSDLAVLDVDGVRDLRPVELGRSADLEVGSAVVAVGSPLGLSGTVTTGIVSALDRTVRTSGDAPLRHLVQTDAAINPGNSGGALVDAAGRLIGINTAISTTGGGGSIGLGFAVPVDEATRVAQQLVRGSAAPQ